MNKYKSLLLMVIGFLGFTITAMEKALIMEARTQAIDHFLELPIELKIEILKVVNARTLKTASSDLKDASKNLISLSLVSKQYYKLINDHNIIDRIILDLSKKFGGHTIFKIVSSLKQPTGYEWLGQFIEKNPQLFKHEAIYREFGLALDINDLRMIAMFLKLPGVDINHRDELGFPLLIRALSPYVKRNSMSGTWINIKTARILLDNSNLNVNATVRDSYNGRQPDSRGIIHADNSLLHELVAGAVDMSDKDMEIFELLLNHPDINVNIRNSITGLTPLGLAESLFASNPDPKTLRVIELLKEKGAHI